MNNLLVIKSAIKADVPVLLEGHTGTGKTHTIMKLAKEMGKTLHVINVSGELTVDSILGQQTLFDGNVVWRDGVLTSAMKKGEWVLFDEMNTALPEVLTVINGVLDDSRSVTLPNADNERVQAHEDFRFIGTQNPSSGQYAGTGRLNDALLNRMVKIEFGYMDGPDEVQALKEHSTLKDNSILALVRVAQWTRNRTDNPLSTRDLVKVLRLRDKGGMSVKDALSFVAQQKYSEDEYSDLHNYFDKDLADIKRFAGGTSQDPMDYIEAQFNKLQDERTALEKAKMDIRTEVKRELLRDLLGGKGDPASALPEDF